ncbi:hypothetical protein [Saccharopolyspora spinosa]|nr:hypothetical protein [Saccharopolyspora spinosa]
MTKPPRGGGHGVSWWLWMAVAGWPGVVGSVLLRGSAWVSAVLR